MFVDATKIQADRLALSLIVAQEVGQMPQLPKGICFFPIPGPPPDLMMVSLAELQEYGKILTQAPEPETEPEGGA